MMGKRGARHRHPLPDIFDAEPLRPSPHQQAENLQPTRLPECAELIDKIAHHDISSIIEISNAQAQAPPRALSRSFPKTFPQMGHAACGSDCPTPAKVCA